MVIIKHVLTHIPIQSNMSK